MRRPSGELRGKPYRYVVSSVRLIAGAESPGGPCARMVLFDNTAVNASRRPSADNARSRGTAYGDGYTACGSPTGASDDGSSLCCQMPISPFNCQLTNHILVLS